MRCPECPPLRSPARWPARERLVEVAALRRNLPDQRRLEPAGRLVAVSLLGHRQHERAIQVLVEVPARRRRDEVAALRNPPSLGEGPERLEVGARDGLDAAGTAPPRSARPEPALADRRARDADALAPVAGEPSLLQLLDAAAARLGGIAVTRNRRSGNGGGPSSCSSALPSRASSAATTA